MEFVVTQDRLPVCVGIDIGQLHDPTSICVCEVAQVDTGKIRYTREPELGHHDERGNWIPPTAIEHVMRSEYTIRHIKRLPLGTSYPDVAMHIADMLCSKLFQDRSVRVLMDITGVGFPVYQDLKKEAALRKECRHVQLKPISFTFGETYNKSKGTLGKAFLVSRLQSLLQAKRVHGPDTSEMKATLDELRVYEIKVSDAGKDTYGAFKTGTHDDLATAMALACLECPYSERVSYSKRVY